MKKLLTLAVLLAVCLPLLSDTILVQGPPQKPLSGGGGGGGGGSAFTVSQHMAVLNGGAGDNITSTSTNTVGATWIVIALANYQGEVDGFNNSMVDNQSNTYTKLTQYGPGSGGRNYVTWFYCMNPVTSATHTFTAHGRIPNYVVIWGTGGTPAFDTTTGTSAGSGTTLQPGSITAGGSPCALFLASANADATSLSSVNSSFTILENINHTANGASLGVSWLAQTTATAVNPTSTFSGSASPAVTMISIK
jgi:hypothetical protein